MAESSHVYIKNGFDRLKNKQDEIHILEIGFGTGLNTLLTLDNCLPNSSIFYTALEPFPIKNDVFNTYYNEFDIKPNSLSFLPSILSNNLNTFSLVNTQFMFCLSHCKIQDLKLNTINDIYKNSHAEFKGFDLIYYDAFAPSKQADMWTEKPILNAIDLLKKDGIIVTYCAQGAFKRLLKSLNLRLENPPGLPPKREITVGFK